jgi:hypothetical protein
MKTSLKIFALGLVLAGFGVNANAQVNATGTSNAKILKPITISVGSALEFGSMAEKTAGDGGTCTVSTSGGRSSSTLNLAVLTGATPSAGAFTVTGEPEYTYAVTLPSTITITKVSSTETMTVGTLLAKCGAGGTDSHTATGTLAAGTGTQTFTVGGTLTVTGSQAQGAYTGTYQVTVAYN